MNPPLRHRKNIVELTGTDLAALRQGLVGMEAIADDRGYSHWAGIHGLPLPIYCKHGDPLFLPWHRAYLYFFEQYLMDQSSAASLPWWDWTTQDGIPAPYAAAALDDGSPNPLASGPITGISAEQFKQFQVPDVAVTYRQPDDPGNLPSPAQINDILTAPDFTDFTLRLEDVHNGVHEWTGGTMGLIPLAAYDPIFWAHHTMIDRLWSVWQLRNPGASATFERSFLDTPLEPFPTLTVRGVLDVTSLGYDYAAAAASAVPMAASPQGGGA